MFHRLVSEKVISAVQAPMEKTLSTCALWRRGLDKIRGPQFHLQHEPAVVWNSPLGVGRIPGTHELAGGRWSHPQETHQLSFWRFVIQVYRRHLPVVLLEIRPTDLQETPISCPSGDSSYRSTGDTYQLSSWRFDRAVFSRVAHPS